MTTFANDRELHDATARRDVQSVSPAAARFTDPKAFLATLKQDVELGAVQDGIVYLGITSGPATLDQVKGRPVLGGERNAPTFQSSYVSLSYMARNMLHVLSAYCGVVWKDGDDQAPHFARDISTATGLRVQETSRAVQSGLSKLEGLQVRTAGALHLHAFDDDWMAHPEQGIEELPEERCYQCGVAIHFANGKWRDESGKFDVYAGANALGRGRSTYDHTHAPSEPEVGE